MPWIEPKINWSSEDYYNFEDLNRVENNIEVIKVIVNLYFKDMDLTINRTRNMKSIEFADSLNRIEKNIKVLKENSVTPLIWIDSKLNWQPGTSFNFEDANRLENNLLHLFNLLEITIDNFKYCGTLNCGEGGI